MKFYGPNIFDEGTVTVTGGTSVSTHPQSRLYDHYENLYWYLTGTGFNFNIAVDQSGLSSPYDADVLVIANHNLTSVTGSIYLKYSDDNSTWYTESTLSITDTTRHVQSLSGRSAKYWKLVVYGATTPRIGELYLAPSLEMTVLEGAGYRRVSDVTWQRAVGGHESSICHGPGHRERTYTSELTDDEREDFEDFIDLTAGNRLPFYVEDHREETWLARFGDMPEFSETGTGRIGVSFGLVEVI